MKRERPKIEEMVRGMLIEDVSLGDVWKEDQLKMVAASRSEIQTPPGTGIRQYRIADQAELIEGKEDNRSGARRLSHSCLFFPWSRVVADPDEVSPFFRWESELFRQHD